jgi:TrmH family RNA methyltransferase
MPLSKPHLRRYRRLHQAKGRRESGRFLVEGPTLIREALKEGRLLEEAVLTAEFAANPEGRDLVRLLGLAGVPHSLCSLEEMSRLAEAMTPQGAAAIAKLPPEMPPPKADLLLVCEAVSDPGNLGSLLRTADWFGVERVALGPGSADPYSPKAVRASAGAIFRVAVEATADLAALLAAERSAGRRLFAAVMTGDRRPETLPTAGLRGLVVGHETRGVSPAVAAACESTVRILSRGRTESLNLAVAAGILLYLMATEREPWRPLPR